MFQILTALPYNYHQSLPRHFSGPQGGTLSSSSTTNSNSSNSTAAAHYQNPPQHRLPSISAAVYADHQQQQLPQPQRPLNNYNNLRTSSYYTTTTLGGGSNNGSSRGLRYNGASSTNTSTTNNPLQNPRLQQQQHPPYSSRPSPLGGTGTLQPPKQYDSYYYHPSTLGPAQRSGGSKPPLPSSSHGHTSAGAPQTAPGPNSKVVYADLSLEGPPMGCSGRDPRSTDYAVLKFNTKNVGKEIDV